MSSIEDEGFLSDQINQWIEKHRNKNTDWFELCDDINRFSQQTMFSINVHNNDLVELMASALYARAMSNFQGIIIMSERGMINEAKILTRCFLECMFKLVAIEKDNNFAKTIILEDLFQRRDYLKAYKRTKEIGIASENYLSLEEIEHLIQDLEKMIKSNGVKKITKRDIAVKAELESIYDTAYKILSSTVHIAPRDLGQYLNNNETENIQEISWGPDIEGIDIILFTAAESMLFVLSSLSNIYRLSYSDIWETIVNRYNKLSKELI
jgi:hypothetical protein